MNFFELMFNTGPGLMAIFKYGVQPREEDFLELTQEQYRKLEESGVDYSEKMYAWVPLKLNYEMSELLVLSESEKNVLFEADNIIDKYCQESEEILINYDEKLKYAGRKLPSVFSEETMYGRKTLVPVKPPKNTLV